MAHDTDSYPGLRSHRSTRPDADSDTDEPEPSDPSDDLPRPDYEKIGPHAFDAESLEIFHRGDVSYKVNGYVALADHAATTSPWQLTDKVEYFDDDFLATREPDDEVGWFYLSKEIVQDVLDEYLVEFETSDRDDGNDVEACSAPQNASTSRPEDDVVEIGPHEWDAETLVIVDKQDVGVTSHGYLAVAEHTRDSEAWKIGPDEMLDASFRATRDPDDVAWFYGPDRIADDVVEEYLIEPPW